MEMNQNNTNVIPTSYQLRQTTVGLEKAHDGVGPACEVLVLQHILPDEEERDKPRNAERRRGTNEGTQAALGESLNRAFERQLRHRLVWEQASVVLRAVRTLSECLSVCVSVCLSECMNV